MDILNSLLSPSPSTPQPTPLFSSSKPSKRPSRGPIAPLPPLLLATSAIHILSGTTYLLSPLLIQTPESIPVIQNLGLQNLSWGVTILIATRFGNKTTHGFIWWGLISKDLIVCLGNAAFWGWRVLGERRRRWKVRKSEREAEEEKLDMPGMYLASARELEEGLPLERKRAIEVERAQKTLFGRLAIENVLTSTAFLSLAWFLLGSKSARGSLRADLWTGVFKR
ncbi:hypothetical protein P154DRAFT_189767 [Amniculicola lignicola CBS 123094]|uniref:Uncharacterized protein n=1 Tax=Amniculicola lignicola CBS 123094 TaxID=1392246 RepID=A0A6A5WJA8_9PLEO|nr:hypothetical protein P154DRAFT_189767 [Amniculicola lignicola CBS 123094]